MRVLAQLAKLPLAKRSGNRPSESLSGLFRTWLPQTSAPITQRIEALNWLMTSEPDIGFEITDKLVYSHSDTGSHGARPRWRSDDAGHGRGVPYKERVAMLGAAADHQVAVAQGNVGRLCRLIDKLDAFDKPRISRILDSVTEFGSEGVNSDEDRERVRSAMRKRINWHQQRRARRSEKLPPFHGRLIKLYDAIAPADLVVRHRWLFRDGWAEPPIRRWKQELDGRSEAIEKARKDALREILVAEGMAGVERLSAAASGHGYVGNALTKAGVKVGVIKP